MSSRSMFSVIASVALHVVILTILVVWHRSSEKTEGPNAPAMETPPVSALEAEAPKGFDKPVETRKPAEARKPISTLSSEDETVEARPVAKPVVKPAVKPEPKPVAKTEKPAKSEKPAKGHQIVTYVVKPGDSLTAIAKECGCTPAELAKLNGKTYKAFSKLWVGQKIKIKAKEE